MSNNSGREIEYINGKAGILLQDYVKEADDIKSRLPKATEHVAIPDNGTLVAEMKDTLEKKKKAEEIGKRVLEENSPPAPVQKVKRQYTLISDEMRRVITNIFRNSKGKMDIAKVSSDLGISEKTLRYFQRKLKKGGSIERSTVKKGRHTIITKNILADLNKMFHDRTARSDSQAAKLLQEKGIKISRQTIQRAMTDGIMEKNGFKSLTMHRVYHRGKGANTDQNKEARKIAMSKLLYFRKQKYHPVFVDETHWSIGWAWNRQRGPKGEKIVVENGQRSYDITAISSITELGPGYTLIVEGASISSATFSAYMKKLMECGGEEKQVFFLDNASVHKKEDLLPTIHSVKGKEIVFNAPYSPECNPIEKFFANWKRRVEMKCTVAPSPSDFVKIIEDTYMSIPPYECLDVIEDVYNEVLEKVNNGDDM